MFRDFFRRLHIHTQILKEEHGQTMAEYGVVLAVITIGVVVALTALSGGITNALNAVKGKLPKGTSRGGPASRGPTDPPLEGTDR